MRSSSEEVLPQCVSFEAWSKLLWLRGCHCPPADGAAKWPKAGKRYL